MSHSGTPSAGQHARSGGAQHFLALTMAEVLVLLAVKRLGPKLSYSAAIREMISLHVGSWISTADIRHALASFRENGMLEATPGGGRQKILYALTERAHRALDRITLAQADLIRESSVAFDKMAVRAALP